MKANTIKTEEDRARQQAIAQLESIREMVADYQEATDNDNEEAREEAIQSIEEDPLSVEIRSEWHTPGSKTPGGQYNILLCTGGPAVRIIGELNEYNQPETAKIEYQDWFTPWVEYPINSEEEEDVITYANMFYYE